MWSGDDIYFMKLALEEAEKADSLGEVPIGAILVLLLAVWEAAVKFEASPVVPSQVRSYSASRPVPPDRQDLLPPGIAPHTVRFKTTAKHSHISFEQGGGHHGSHPHMVHEFIRSILEDRELLSREREGYFAGALRA